MRGRTWAWVGLVAVLLFDLWWRSHTVGPTLRERFGIDLGFPDAGRESEPLDCDEAIYAYIGKRIAGGSVLYRDLTENKPPLGYWLFALAVSIGGADELTVRLMPVPIILATTALVWRLGLRLGGPVASALAASIFAVVSADPFLYGNGNQMEHMINLFSTAALVALVSGWDRPGRARFVIAGACLGASALVKQVAALNAAVFALALWSRHGGAVGPGRRPRLDRLGDVVWLSAGCLAVWMLAALIVAASGAGGEAVEDIFRYGPALATDVPADPHAPPFLARWVTGNADPTGALPPPFGRTRYLVWWGTGSWPVWLMAVPGLAWLVLGPGADGPRRLAAAWTLSAWAQAALPRLFWAHYYLLPVPGLAVVGAVFSADLIALARAGRVAARFGVLAVALALGATARLQIKEYARVDPEELTIRDKGGRQWVALRALGRELKRRAAVWPRPTLHVWGWQSPLFFYSGLDGVTPQVFADDLVKTFAGSDHRLVRPRVERTMRDLRANPPSLIFAGYAPFPALRAFLDERYLPSRLVRMTPDGRGLWVERSRYGEFERGPRPWTPRARPPNP